MTSTTATPLLAVLAALVAAPSASAGDCPAGRDGSLQKVAPVLWNDARLSPLFRSFAVRAERSALVIDEHHLTLTLVARRAPRALLPLALPAPYVGSVSLALDVPIGGCVDVEVVLFDGALRSATFAAPASLRGAIKSGERVHKSIETGAAAVTLAPGSVALGDEPGARLYLGQGAPDPTALLAEQGGIDGYLASLAALEVALSPAERARFDFLVTDRRLRRELSSMLPRARQTEIARFDEGALPKSEQPLLRFWRQQLNPASSPTDARARLLIDDQVDAVWVEGNEVYVRAPGVSSSVEVPLGDGAARVWIVSTESGRTTTIHDTHAVLKKGELYSVAKTMVQHIGAGARRECLRVDGALPSRQRIYWRDLGTPPGPILGAEDAYRPPFDAAERSVTVVSNARGGALFPPIPLVYSYTHPGSYRWRLAADGTVRLDLIDDDELCPQVVKDPLVRP
ncbi:MAG: hypothetical protein HYS27_04365 [Deltaproteobacteria bacterium]|nr:hypothetical protein [Deltaproteobacteria bacterium]